MTKQPTATAQAVYDAARNAAMQKILRQYVLRGQILTNNIPGQPTEVLRRNDAEKAMDAFGNALLSVEQLKHDREIADLRLYYAASIGLLCELSLKIGTDEESKEFRERIWQAVTDWCDKTGWRCKQTLSRIEVFPPKNEEVKNDTGR